MEHVSVLLLFRSCCFCVWVGGGNYIVPVKVQEMFGMCLKSGFCLDSTVRNSYRSPISVCRGGGGG